MANRKSREPSGGVEEESSTYVLDKDGDPDEARSLMPLQAAACTYRIAFGPRAGRRVLTVQGVIPRDADFKQRLCADIDGFSLHTTVRCGADDRPALEKRCRYITHPTLVNEHLQTDAAGQVVLKLKTPWRDGITHLVMSPLEFKQRLAALESRPRRHQPMTPSRLSIRLGRYLLWVDCRPTRTTPDRHPIFLALALRSHPAVTGRIRC